jgi:alpha-tubulin suppressor-like RCC1 family protein
MLPPRPASQRRIHRASWLALLVALACSGGGDSTGPDGGGGNPPPTPGPVATLTVVSGGGQQGTPGAALAAPVVVKAVDARGNAVPNAAITFTAGGGGSAAPANATTNASGQAQTVWTLGAAEGAQTLTAASGSISASIAATAQVGAPAFLSAAQVEAGNLAQCAVSAAGQLSCWGDNGNGLVGDGSTNFRQFPIAINPAGVTFAKVSVGSSNACALTSTGAAYCWGTGGANGDGSSGTPRLTPVAVSGGHVFTKIVAGNTTVCALKADGTAWCWGTTSTSTGATARTTPTLVSSTIQFTDVAAGSTPNGAQDYNCGISTTGQTYCWGIAGIGASPDPALAPTALGGGVTFTALTFGRNHACGLAADGRAYCWGLNDQGQVGDGSTTTRATPVAVSSGSTRFVALTAGGSHTCGLTAAGAAHCWGSNRYNQLGDGTSALTRTTPVAVSAPTGVQFASVTAGQFTTCATATGSEVYCWGARGTQAIVIQDPTPVRVPTR